MDATGFDPTLPVTAPPIRRPGRSRFAKLGALGLAASLAIAACGGGGGTQSPGGGGGGTSQAPSGSAGGGGTSAEPSGSGGGGGGGGTGMTLQPPANPVELTLWNALTGPDGEAFNEIVDRFNQETPNVQVTVATQPGPEFQQRLEAAASANQLPQLAVLGYDQIPLNAENGLITPIDDFVEQAGLQAADFSEDVWNAGQWKDQRFGAPINAHTLTFFWNKAIFREAGLDPEAGPTNREEFEAALTAINDKTDKPGYMVVASGGPANFLQGLVFSTLFYQGGGQWTNEDFSQATFNSEAGVAAAEYIASLVNDFGAPKVEADAEINAFKAGDNGMLFAGIWETRANSEALGDELGVGPVPQFFGPGVWAGSHNLTVLEGAEGDQRQGAYYFMEWFNQQSLEFANGGQIPALKSVRDELETSDEGLLPLIAKIAPQFEDARFLPTIPGAGALMDGEQGSAEAAIKVINGQASAQEALDQSAAYYTQILQESKQQYGY